MTLPAGNVRRLILIPASNTPAITPPANAVPRAALVAALREASNLAGDPAARSGLRSSNASPNISVTTTA